MPPGAKFGPPLLPEDEWNIASLDHLAPAVPLKAYKPET